MPSSAEHREKADLHRRFLDAIDPVAHPEWAAVAAFYTALHLVERLAACDNKHHDRHQQRLDYLLRHKTHRAIHPPMSALRDASEKARYGTVNQFRRAFPGDAVVTLLIEVCLAAVQDHVDETFAAAGPNPPP